MPHLYCYSANQEDTAGSRLCCQLLEKHEMCRGNMAWVLFRRWSHYQADHHSNDQQDTNEALGLLQANKLKSFFGEKGLGFFMPYCTDVIYQLAKVTGVS